MNKLSEILSNDVTFNNLMHMIFLTIFTLIAIVLHKAIETNNDNVDKIAQIANKAGIECQVKTNNVLYVTVKKIVK